MMVVRQSNRGFTLLEMVVAIAIFAVIGAISYTTLNQFIKSRESLEARNHKVRLLQQTFARFGDDVRYMVNRPVRDGLGDAVPAFIAGAEFGGDGRVLEFTTSRPHMETNLWHRLQRVEWMLIDGELIRKTWLVLDRDFDSQSREQYLLTDVLALEVGLIKVDRKSGRVTNTRTWEDESALPDGVEILLTLAEGETYRRIVEVGGEG